MNIKLTTVVGMLTTATVAFAALAVMYFIGFAQSSPLASGLMAIYLAVWHGLMALGAYAEVKGLV